MRGREMFVEVWTTKRSVVNSQHSICHKCHSFDSGWMCLNVLRRGRRVARISNVAAT